MSRGKVVVLAALLCVLLVNVINAAHAQFIGPQGWAFVLSGANTNEGDNVLNAVRSELQHTSRPSINRIETPGLPTKPQITPQQYINLIIQNMTLDQKLGQMMIVQFLGSAYSPALSSMVNQYHAGTVLLFAINGNIVNRQQLKDLTHRIEAGSSIPLSIAIDQEGGAVDRLADLDGSRPSAASIGASGNPAKAKAQGLQDAYDLTSYGINLNLAPVVDVSTVYNPQLATRTYGSTPALVTRMSTAYLAGLQQSGKVIGTLKHFPGLGDVGVDPHVGVPHLTRSKKDLEQGAWAPYRALIRQGSAHAIMVTHEIVEAIDPQQPSTLSAKIVTGILRNELGFQGVVMTDSLTMEGITAYYTVPQAAVRAIIAGNDLLMGASSPDDMAAMFDGIKQAMKNGTISQSRIDASVRRILMMKYQMKLLPLPKNE